MTKVLDVKNLRVYFHTPLGPVKAVDGISFDLNPKERLGIVGESGSGKSTMAYSLMRLIKKPGKIESGEIIVGGEDILSLEENQMRARRFSKISLIPQGSMNSLNPVMRIEEQLIDTVRAHDESKSSISKSKKQEIVSKLLKSVGLDPELGKRFPHELSGGMKQRVTIAMGISLNPTVIIADEPTSALDVVVQRQVMDTLESAQERIVAGLILVGHDMGLMAQFVDRIAVMYAGKIVEIAPVETIFNKPLHPYTKMLIKSLPKLDSHGVFNGIPGLPAQLLNLEDGCSFCLRIGRLNKKEIPWVKISKSHYIRECKVCSDYN